MGLDLHNVPQWTMCAFAPERCIGVGVHGHE